MSRGAYLEGFCWGCLTATVVYFLADNFSKSSRNKQVEKPLEKTKPVISADDDCHSLFYGAEPSEGGCGFPSVGTIDVGTVTRMCTIHNDYARLPFDFYKRAVESLPIVCVDVICKRNDGKFLLFYRRDKPAANLWWWPGGRLFRGETFFDTAVRKIRDETGCPDAKVTPIGFVNVWNTFFPDSHWDSERGTGREGTQTVNIVVVCELGDGQELACLGPDAKEQWAVEAHRWISASEALVPNMYDKYVTLNVKLAIEKGFLS